MSFNEIERAVGTPVEILSGNPLAGYEAELQRRTPRGPQAKVITLALERARNGFSLPLAAER